MVPHKGRLSYKQYIKNKPIRWGIKLWVLCETKTGYVYNFDVYLGKDEGNVDHNLAQRVVKKPVMLVENKYHHLYMDNFYCDPHLFLELERKGILACGTIRANRKGFPKNIVLTSAMERTMNHGDYLWRNHGSLVAMAWCDKCTVYLFTWSPLSILQISMMSHLWLSDVMLLGGVKPYPAHLHNWLIKSLWVG